MRTDQKLSKMRLPCLRPTRCSALVGSSGCCLRKILTKCLQAFTKSAPAKDKERKQEVTVTCAQACGASIFSFLVACHLMSVEGSEIYVGCSDGALLRFGLRSSGRDSVRHLNYPASFGPNFFGQSESYSLLSSQKVPVTYGSAAGMSKGVEDIIVLPSISRALVLCGMCPPIRAWFGPNLNSLRPYRPLLHPPCP